MSETITVKKLDIVATIKEGTTIGLWVGIVSKASRGEAIPMTEIFDWKAGVYTPRLAAVQKEILNMKFYVLVSGVWPPPV